MRSRSGQRDQRVLLGGCAIWAAVAAKTHGWQVWAIGDESCTCDPAWADGYGSDDRGNWCMCRCNHFVAKAPDGMIWDARGEHHPEGVAVDGQVLRPVPEYVLDNVIES